MSKLSIIIFAVLLVSVAWADEKLEEAKRRCDKTLVITLKELTEKYLSVNWHSFEEKIKNEAIKIYVDGIEKGRLLRLEVPRAKTMEVTEEFRTFSGKLILCNPEIASVAFGISHDVSRALDELYERATGGKKRV